MGGRDNPASGFALYLDPLMSLVKPQATTQSSTQKILVRIEPDQPETAKEGFSIAKRLRDAGYVAELQLGKQSPVDLSWTLDVRSKSPRFVLTDKANNKESEAPTADEVLKLL